MEASWACSRALARLVLIIGGDFLKLDGLGGIWAALLELGPLLLGTSLITRGREIGREPSPLSLCATVPWTEAHMGGFGGRESTLGTEPCLVQCALEGVLFSSADLCRIW